MQVCLDVIIFGKFLASEKWAFYKLFSYPKLTLIGSNNLRPAARDRGFIYLADDGHGEQNFSKSQFSRRQWCFRTAIFLQHQMSLILKNFNLEIISETGYIYEKIISISRSGLLKSCARFIIKRSEIRKKQHNMTLKVSTSSVE